MKGLDGIQGPVYVGTGCVFRRQALYGYNPPKGPKRPKMVSCDCCPCFGRRKKVKHAMNDANGEAAGLRGSNLKIVSNLDAKSLYKLISCSPVLIPVTRPYRNGR
jgi:hypothetical protein